jgi:excisionase family DNA binding protein
MTELKTINEVAPILRVKPVTVRRLVFQGRLPYVKIGRRYCFTDEHIKTFIAHNEKKKKTEGSHEAPR